jgi:hypothetical protein
MRKYIIICLLIFILIPISYSQEYENEIGIRVGFFSGMTFKYVVKDKFAVDVILDSRWKGYEVIGLYEIYKNAFGCEQLKWYFGGGGHVGIFKGNYVTWGKPGLSYEVIGIDAIAGLEYRFRKTPISLGLDWKPSFSVFGYSGFWADDGAISVRYIF